MEEQPPKSLEQWASEIKESKPMWLVFYAEMLGTRVTNIPRLYRTVNLYGFWPVFEAIVDTSTRSINGDPLAYVLKVASNKWKEEQEVRNEQTDYENAVKQSKEASQKANKDLAKRLAKRRKA